MVTTVRIATAALAAARAHAVADPAREACGLLLGGEGGVEQALPAANVAADPARFFEVDPVVLLAAHRAARSGGPAILGCYHSHPHGPPSPSPRDAAAAAPDGWLWLILGMAGEGMWRAVANGTVHGRFDPVACERVADGAGSDPCP